MLRIDLGRLDREGTVALDVSVPPDDPMFSGLDLGFAGPVRMELRASPAGSGEIVVQGRVHALLERECRRCLEPVSGELDEEVTLVFADADDLDPEGSGDMYAFDADAAELDVTEAMREELILSIDPFIVCEPECKGLCPMCGTNLNESSCTCVREESDPRWGALRALKEE